MKLSAFSFIIAGAGLLQANASPLRVVFEPTQLLSTVSNNNETVAQIHAPPHKVHTQIENGNRRGCGSARFKQKALDISNRLRQALGLPLIQDFAPVEHHHGPGRGGKMHILPFFGTPQDFDGKEVDKFRHHRPHHDHEHPDTEVTQGDEGWVVLYKPHDHHRHHEMMEGEDGEEGSVPHHRHHHPHHHNFHGKGHFHHQHKSFMRRVHFALMSLGVWEGRAVAFVLGCGLGVLLRMLWVLTVVAVRTIRGSDDQETETHYVAVPNQYDAEEIFVAPPVYILDEKAELKAEVN